ncbi:hypothetical protein MtrunA17_Chr1g0165851 [Medicago truncatula]|uniref:Uncharacterized protein n=1 Tax=Medicago truncatula TaxID=3880 RepID=A0A396JM56_MEDTR|nr:hypothetical protein MtrunA17_Chr1g0165851 [Medicago truncatula]
MLKEKLKNIKGCLKLWHQQHFQNFDGNISEVKDRISTLDTRGEDFDLMAKELKDLYSLTSNLFTLCKLNSSKLW